MGQQLECNHIVRLIFKPHLTVCERRYGFQKQKQTKNLIFKRTANKVASLSGSNMDQKEQLHIKKSNIKTNRKANSEFNSSQGQSFTFVYHLI